MNPYVLPPNVRRSDLRYNIIKTITQLKNDNPTKAAIYNIQFIDPIPEYFLKNKSYVLKQYKLSQDDPNLSDIIYMIAANEVKINQIIYSHYQECSENITCFFDVSSDGKYVYLVGELFDMDLNEFRRLIQKYNKIEKLKISFPIYYNIISGLSTLDELGIIHNDIKLENIFVKKLNNHKIKISIADFDISCSNYLKDIQCKYFVGTSELMDPFLIKEKLINKNVIPDKSEYDTYSASLTIYQLLFEIIQFPNEIIKIIDNIYNVTSEEKNKIIKFYDIFYKSLKDNINSLLSEVNNTTLLNSIEKIKYSKFLKLIKYNLNPNILKPNPIIILNILQKIID
jgi:serine/threonine protein kinase